MGLSIAEAERLAVELEPGQPASPGVQRLLDKLWLRSVMVEQLRRTNRGERAAFVERCDRILDAL
jgi:hypothetical protein